MRRLYILYDQQCAFCRRCRVWLSRQPAFVQMVFIPLQSAEAECRFPGIEKLRPDKELIVIGENGDLWQGANAWIMCLWALREYREWSQRLAHPALQPLARRACRLISDHRQNLPAWLLSTATGTEELRQKLEAAGDQECTNEGFCKTR